MKNKCHAAIAIGFGIGKIPYAPGTFGSLFAVTAWVVLNRYFTNLGLDQIEVSVLWFPFVASLFILGAYCSEFYSRKTGKGDDKEIVIDEICGQLITFLIAGIFMDTVNNYLLIFLAFACFRLFDITKPFIIGLADQHIKGGIGVMFDDLLSGFAAAVLLYAINVFILS